MANPDGMRFDLHVAGYSRVFSGYSSAVQWDLFLFWLCAPTLGQRAGYSRRVVVPGVAAIPLAPMVPTLTIAYNHM